MQNWHMAVALCFESCVELIGQAHPLPAQPWRGRVEVIFIFCSVSFQQVQLLQLKIT
jgi:hypothetical protein